MSRPEHTVGSRLKVYFKKGVHNGLMVESEAGTTSEIHGVCLGDVEFKEETTPRGATRCVAFGTLLVSPNSHEASGMKVAMSEAGKRIDFYWNRDKKWPFAKAREAHIAGPQRGFESCIVVDPE